MKSFADDKEVGLEFQRELGKRMMPLYAEILANVEGIGGDPKLVSMFVFYDGEPMAACIDKDQAKTAGVKLGLTKSPAEVYNVGVKARGGKIVETTVEKVDELEVEEIYGTVPGGRDPHERGN